MSSSSTAKSFAVCGLSDSTFRRTSSSVTCACPNHPGEVSECHSKLRVISLTIHTQAESMGMMFFLSGGRMLLADTAPLTSQLQARLRVDQCAWSW